VGKRARLAAAGACAALAALAASLPSAAWGDGAQNPPGSASYGLVAFSGNFVPGETVEERTAAYRQLYRAGVRAIRVDIPWVQVEPRGQPLGDYDFSERDRELRAITRAGLKVIGILDYGHPDYSLLGDFLGGTPVGGGIPPFYVANAQYFPPDDPEDFAAYARTVAEHYGEEVVAWEVWNEENEGWRFWPPHEDPAAYARLLCAAHDELGEVDPETPVLFGGVFFPAAAELPGMSGPTFVQAAYDAQRGLGGCFDAMAYHPYPYPFTAPELDVPVRGSVLSAADQMQAVLERNGDGGKPLWITEVGWPTHDRAYGVPERKQAQYVARMQAATLAQRIPVLTWYTYGDYEDPSGFNQEAWFGFFRPDGSPKPSYEALRTFHRLFRRSRFARDRSQGLGLPPGALMTGGRGFALQYRRRERNGGRTRITALWLACESSTDGQNSGGEDCSAPTSVPVQLPVRARGARVVDHLGEGGFVAATGGELQLEVGPGPVYVLDTRRARR
jgi:hypothetical protein